DGFGQIISETGIGFRGRYAWTGRDIDTETGFQYNRERYYDPTTGRWISQDPLGYEAGDSNLYRYVSNASMSMTDPGGQQQGGFGSSPNMFNPVPPFGGGSQPSQGFGPGRPPGQGGYGGEGLPSAAEAQRQQRMDLYWQQQQQHQKMMKL